MIVSEAYQISQHKEIQMSVEWLYTYFWKPNCQFFHTHWVHESWIGGLDFCLYNATNKKETYFCDTSFSHNATAAKLVFQNNELKFLIFYSLISL